jgi:flagellar protein FliJ
MTRKQTLSKVLELKGFTQEQLEAEVRKKNDTLSLEKDKLELLEETLSKTDAKFNAGQGRELLNVNEISILYDYHSYLNRKIEEQKNVVFKLAAELEVKKSEMIEVYKEKKIFEKLRDKIIHEESRTIVRSEQKEADYNYISGKMRK